ncbi:MAG: AAA family ATPase [Verrucomicrobia bacterium]|nr:AAA family ATPase [Verrucomicrobiota bacterium]MBS0645875.1 AAA family ATPase [Verrucomicrobiota bacterium]
MTNAQTLPCSKESEMMVIGCMLTNQEALQIASEGLEDRSFYFKEHQLIFNTLKKFHKNGKAADLHLIMEELKTQDTLEEAGGIGYLVSLAQYAGTSAYVEEYVEIIKNKSILREIFRLGQEAEIAALNDPNTPTSILEELSIKLKRLESRQCQKIPILDASERWKKEEEFLAKYRGKKYLGLRVQKIEEFNEHLLGLRGLILLAAAPNVGKTALTVQTAIDVLSTEKDACLVYLSLEMTEEQIFRRMLLHLSGIDFHNFVFGSQSQQELDSEGRFAFFTPEEIRAIDKAKTTIINFDQRLQIVDQSTYPFMDARTIIHYVESLKQKTSCSRALVVVDYLQVWPVITHTRLIENEADKWRIGEMKKIRDALRDDPIIVISEARKPGQNDDVWGGDLSDVMGSARGTYTPDVVMLFSQLQPKTLKKLWEAKKMPVVPIREGQQDINDESERIGSSIISLLADVGISICKLKVPKCRDGMKRFITLMMFHFNRNQFTPINWANIKMLVERKLAAEK